MDGVTTVLIVESYPIVVAERRLLLSSDHSLRLTEARDKDSGYRTYVEAKPDVAMINIDLAEGGGLELLTRIRKQDRNARLIAFALYKDPRALLRALQLGAKGCLSIGADAGALVLGIRTVIDGGTFISPDLAGGVAQALSRAAPSSQLSPREIEILRLLARGSKLAEVAKEVGVSYKTVANSTSFMKRILQARSHSHLIRVAVDLDPGQGVGRS